MKLLDGSRSGSGLFALLEELRPKPGRFTDTLRIVVLVLLTVAIGETFRMPEIAVSAYVVLFVSRSERASTVMTALIACAAVVFAVFAAIVVFMATLSEPALRVPMIAVATFGAMFLSRVSPLGPAVFAAGFILAYGLTIGDQVLGLSLQSSEVSNTTGFGIPELFSVPPEETLLQSLLWLAPMVALPVGLVVVANLLTGRQPVLLLRAGLADRLAACAGFCAGEPGAAAALTASARAGSAGFAKLLHLAHTPQRAPDYASLIRETERLALSLLAWQMIMPPQEWRIALRPCVDGLRAAERTLRPAGTVTPVVAEPLSTGVVARPLGAETARALTAIIDALGKPPAPPSITGRSARHLISAEAIRNPETVRFAVKVTLAVMLSYAAENLLDWPAIHTCVVTCFFVSLGTVGESLHKATLRIAGALIGGALGIGSILVLMPLMIDLGDLLLALAAVTFLAGWVACGSERISYAGWQIGLAYYLTMLQGYGPTLDMQTARDRVIGIVIGNLIVLVVFTTVWPVPVATAVRRQVAVAVFQFAALMRLERHPPAEAAAARPALEMGFAAAMTDARNLMSNTDYERVAVGLRDTRRSIDSGLLSDMEALIVAVDVVLVLQSDPSWSAAPQTARQTMLSYHDHMGVWFDRCAAWVGVGASGQALEADIPAPPALDDYPSLAGRRAWYGVLDQELRTTMAKIMRRLDVHD